MSENEKSNSPFYWPKYIEKKWRDRTLSYFEECEDGSLRIITEHDLRLLITSVEEMITTLFGHNLILFVSKIAVFRFIESFVRMGCEVFCLEQGKPLAIRIKGERNTSRWISDIGNWDSTRLDQKVLQDLRLTFNHCRVGTHTTPGALGQALMRLAWLEHFGRGEVHQDEHGFYRVGGWQEHRHRRPPAICVEELRKHNTGARSDLIRTDVKNLPRAIERDQKNAYAHHFRRQPTGPAYPTWKDSCKSHLCYWAETKITIPELLRLGCFPIRLPSGELCYPTEPGVYIRWSWKNEVIIMESEGCIVEFTGKGWAWDEMTDEPEVWVRLMEHLRDTAPSPRVAYMIKLAIVAAIGRHNLPDERYVLVSPEYRDEFDRPLTEVTKNGLEIYNLWIHMEPNESPDSLPHWFYYTLSECRISLFLEAKKWLLRDQLLATNTDAVIILPSDDIVTDSDTPRVSGEWGNRELTNVTIPHLRHLISNEKIVTPGKKRA